MIGVCTNVECRIFLHIVGESCVLDYGALYECPVCAKQSLVTKRDRDVPGEIIAAKSTLALSAEEAFGALHGAGLRAHREASADAVRSALAGKRIVSVLLEDTPNPSRCLLQRIQVEDGTVVFLSAGTYGPTVYRIIPPKGSNDDCAA